MHFLCEKYHCLP